MLALAGAVLALWLVREHQIEREQPELSAAGTTSSRRSRPEFSTPAQIRVTMWLTCPVRTPRCSPMPTPWWATASRRRSAPSTGGASAASAGVARSRRPATACGRRAIRPPRDGCALDVLVDGAEAFPAIARRDRARPRLRPRHRMARRAVLRARPRRAPGVLGELLAEAAERVDVRVLVWAGAPVPAFHPTRKEVREGVETLTRGHADPLRGRSARAPVPLPPREDGDRRRRGRVRRRHRHDRLRRRSLRHERPSRPAPARLARRRHAPTRPRRRRCRRSLRAALARADRGDARASGATRAAPASTRSRSCGRSRTACTTRSRTASSGSSRPTCARSRSARRFIYLENQFLWSPEIVRLLADKLRTRRATSSGSWSCSPRRRTTDTTTRSGSSECSPPPTTARDACSPRRSAR